VMLRRSGCGDANGVPCIGTSRIQAASVCLSFQAKRYKQLAVPFRSGEVKEPSDTSRR
jgi:hypothetical protein